jgi:hypothetical protein
MSELDSYNETAPTHGSDRPRVKVRPPLVAVADRRNREPRWLLALTLLFVILVILLFALYVRLPVV